MNYSKLILATALCSSLYSSNKDWEKALIEQLPKIDRNLSTNVHFKKGSHGYDAFLGTDVPLFASEDHIVFAIEYKEKKLTPGKIALTSQYQLKKLSLSPQYNLTGSAGFRLGFLNGKAFSVVSKLKNPTKTLPSPQSDLHPWMALDLALKHKDNSFLNTHIDLDMLKQKLDCKVSYPF